MGATANPLVFQLRARLYGGTRHYAYLGSYWETY
jgi:hypothetical protein